MERLGDWLDRQTAAWRMVDPDTFCQACIDLEVWEPWEADDAMDSLEEYFDEDDVWAATMRFLNVAAALEDDTLVEFLSSTDEGHVRIPNAVFWAAATAPYTDDEEMLDPRAWRVAIMEILAERERREAED